MGFVKDDDDEMWVCDGFETDLCSVWMNGGGGDMMMMMVVVVLKLVMLLGL